MGHEEGQPGCLVDVAGLDVEGDGALGIEAA
jgi:hypothetical protein